MTFCLLPHPLLIFSLYNIWTKFYCVFTFHNFTNCWKLGYENSSKIHGTGLPPIGSYHHYTSNSSFVIEANDKLKVESYKLKVLPGKNLYHIYLSIIIIIATWTFTCTSTVCMSSSTHEIMQRTVWYEHMWVHVQGTLKTLGQGNLHLISSKNELFSSWSPPPPPHC